MWGKSPRESPLSSPKIYMDFRKEAMLPEMNFKLSGRERYKEGSSDREISKY